MTREPCGKRLVNGGACRLNRYPGAAGCWFHAIGKPRAESWSAEHSRRMANRQGAPPRREVKPYQMSLDGSLAGDGG